MAKKKTRKKVKQAEPVKPKDSPNTFQEVPDDHKFDFGGLPSRDLKKNLGCG
jgi:hypothetical protein